MPELWPNRDKSLIDIAITSDAYKSFEQLEIIRMNSDYGKKLRPNGGFAGPRIVGPGLSAREGLLRPFEYDLGIAKAFIERTRLAPKEGRRSFFADYVVSEHRELRVGFSHTRLAYRKNPVTGIIHVGRPVLLAGAFTYGDGMVNHLNHETGHYQTSSQDVGLLMEAFVAAGWASLIRGGRIADIYHEPYIDR